MIKRIIVAIIIIPVGVFSFLIQPFFELFFWIFTGKAHPPIVVKLTDWACNENYYEEWSKVWEE